MARRVDEVHVAWLNMWRDKEGNALPTYTGCGPWEVPIPSVPWSVKWRVERALYDSHNSCVKPSPDAHRLDFELWWTVLAHRRPHRVRIKRFPPFENRDERDYWGHFCWFQSMVKRAQDLDTRGIPEDAAGNASFLQLCQNSTAEQLRELAIQKMLEDQNLGYEEDELPARYIPRPPSSSQAQTLPGYHLLLSTIGSRHAYLSSLGASPNNTSGTTSESI
ncbi:hypothetical protein QBC46DRAFT_387694 [Diplogelasinospora grovesii]|uniref:Uncharacterized protein n=1 Tax=Diplogelasinospora grovesii TaxID=303347 RepID=A0AAN6N6W3_9PEZI|nr:hypothetical protein QBC46DRAFT_387694 [Diplogelasinospora grovesii]